MDKDYGTQPPPSTGTTTTVAAGPHFSPGELPQTGSDLPIIFWLGAVIAVAGLMMMIASIVRGKNV